MARMYDHYQEYLEWEVIDPNNEITNLAFETGLYKLNKNCIIKFTRNNQYDLVATISGVIENRNEIEPDINKIKGTFIPDETVVGYSLNGLFKYKFFGVVLGAITSTPVSANPLTIKFEAEFIFHKVQKSILSYKADTKNLQEWFLSGNSNINFSRSTSRSVDKSYNKLRDGIDPKDESRTIRSSGNSIDYLFVKFNDTAFIVAKVPKEFGPDWSFNITIEYRQSFGRIPEDEEREAISEIVSFVLGNQLMKIGQTSYDATGSMILQEFKSPWGDNVVSRCQNQALPPVEISNFHDWGRAETLLSQLVEPYINQRATLRLKDALWKYWIAKYSSLGANLPILSSAVETLAERVLNIHPEIKHYYIEYKEFVKMIEDELASIEKKLDSNPHKVVIVNKLKGSSQRGSNEKLKMMFEILKLEVGKIEQDAIKARNKMAHSSIGDISDDEIIRTARLTRAYETLFNRILLKILSYNDKYVDYYTLGHPSRNINDPIPGQ